MVSFTRRRIVVAALLTLSGSAALDFGLDPSRKAIGGPGAALNGGRAVRPPPPKVMVAVIALLDRDGQPTGKFEAPASSPFQLRVQFWLAPGERPPSKVLLHVYHDKPDGKRVVMQAAMADVARVGNDQYEAVLKSNPIRVPGDFRAVVTTVDHRLPAVIAVQRISFLRR